MPIYASGSMNVTNKKKDIYERLKSIADGRKISIGFDDVNIPDKLYLLTYLSMLENVPNMFIVAKKTNDDNNYKNVQAINGKISTNTNVYDNNKEKNNKRKRIEIYDKIIGLLNDLKTIDYE